jgi:NAD(P)H-dependent FMN reductase
MKNIIAFAGSNSKNSINKQLAVYTANQVQGAKVTALDLNDFDLPLYGIAADAQRFLDLIKDADGIVLSLAEHNGAYTTAFKNAFDWMSRLDGKLWSDVPMFLMATSGGARGGATVLEIAKGRFPYMGGNIVADFSLPSFGDNFSDEGISDIALKKTFENSVSAFESVLNS